ncbi:hypothetical protein EVAR_22744_1 [Eumeta japonica]|uniref:Histone-lysine N-methyltransferase SETMAR n=1 Tax=Eumeta variegata TaxID=151549 RepID=A0A4C1UTQ0_EUMVA|nr:hypothetical protein EVAR_22744_1 [Eumeta japonica]
MPWRPPGFAALNVELSWKCLLRFPRPRHTAAAEDDEKPVPPIRTSCVVDFLVLISCSLSGRTNLTDDLREERLSMATFDDKINTMRLMTETDKIIVYQQIPTSLCIGRSQVLKILYKHLAVRKLCTRWIPHNLIEAQKLDCVD